MNVKEEACLYEMTAQGKKWWGDPSSRDFEKDGMNPFGKLSINRKVGSIFSEARSIYPPDSILSFQFKFRLCRKKDDKKFKSDLNTIEPMLNEMFDFERTMAKNIAISDKDFMSSGAFHALRATLKERLEILKAHGTYPNLIRPLR